MTKYNNNWAPGKLFRDEQSHYNKFNTETIQKFFGVRGHWASVEGAPNWVQPVDTEYGKEFRLVRMDDSNNLVAEFPFWINFKCKEGVNAFEKPDPGKGKAVAIWNHRIDAGSLMFWSNDYFKTIIADSDGYCHAIPCRMTPVGGKGAVYNQIRMSVVDGELAHTPFVILAFFMWLENSEDQSEAREVRDYLARIGWSFNATAD